MGLDRASPLRQGNAEPDGGRRRRRGRLQLPKAASSIKSDGPQIRCSYCEVRAPRAHLADRPEPLIHQLSPKAFSAKVWQKVDVEMRGIRLDDLGRRACGVVNPINHHLVRAPLGARLVGRIPIELPETRPPLGFQPRLEGTRIRGANDVTADPLGVLHDEHAPRAQHGIGRGVNVPDQFAISIGCGALGSRRQADAVEVIQILRPKCTDTGYSRLAPV